MNKNPKNRQRRTLELKRETIVYLTDDLLRNVAGGSNDVTNSFPISQCGTQCPGTIKK